MQARGDSRQQAGGQGGVTRRRDRGVGGQGDAGGCEGGLLKGYEALVWVYMVAHSQGKGGVRGSTKLAWYLPQRMLDHLSSCTVMACARHVACASCCPAMLGEVH